ncbi:MAG: hypothetical protein M1834_004780 [Cirrosporium novae-zelandiae]|nr:MAG: hypothetical protein M1834_004780 [Cirrosporium novae-zelandiae]
MLSILRRSIRPAILTTRAIVTGSRYVSTAQTKKEGDISSVFVSLSGGEAEPLPRRFANIKRHLIEGHEDAVQESWQRLLASLREEIPIIEEMGPGIVPEIDFKDIDNPPEDFVRDHKKRGVAVIRNVVPEAEALQYKTDLREYIRQNPQTKAFPPDNPQVFELYWSPSQIRARAHPNLIKTQQFLMSFWHSKDPNALISTSHPTVYADRVRIRQPGDAKFALGPHVDGGSVERWEPNGYGLGGVYNKIFEGNWEEYDPWESSCRLPVQSDLYNGAGACSMFRMYQGWLSMSTTSPKEGTLLVNPLLSRATAYFLLRPFFSPRKRPDALSRSSFLESNNWIFDAEPTPTIQGCALGHCQELNSTLHPHLNLNKSMVDVPKVNPGDYVAWQCDGIHAVDKVHVGKSDSSVLYIPCCPLTELNAEYLVRQREAFINGTPGPDFPGGKGESEHIGKKTAGDIPELAGEKGMRAFGLLKWDSRDEGLTNGQKQMLERANEILGF